MTNQETAKPRARFWAVTVQVENARQGWTGSRQVPYFILDSEVQGIVDAEHAARVATDIVTAAGLLTEAIGHGAYEVIKPHIHVEPFEPEVTNT